MLRSPAIGMVVSPDDDGYAIVDDAGLSRLRGLTRRPASGGAGLVRARHAEHGSR